MPASWKRTLVTLIPKVAAGTHVREFRPISLCTFSYKICAKIMANRLKIVLPSIVGREQGAFIAGRSISDNILVATELYHTVTVARPPSTAPDRMMLKLDLEKAFDRVSWCFIEQVFYFYGFPSTWISWIKGTIQNPSFAFLINGCRSAWSSAGVRQGCPLSPFIFTLCAEILSRLLRREQDHGRLAGIQLVRSLPEISHLRTMWPYSAKLRRVVVDVSSTFCGSIVKCRASWSTSLNRDLCSLSVSFKQRGRRSKVF